MSEPKTAMRRHTPGPWTVFRDDTGGQFTGWPSVLAPDHIDASVVHRAGFRQEYWGDLSQRECVANAYLIAAAPDLLYSLKECVELLQTLTSRESELERATAAIAKAEGTMTDD